MGTMPLLTKNTKLKTKLSNWVRKSNWINICTSVTIYKKRFLWNHTKHQNNIQKTLCE